MKHKSSNFSDLYLQIHGSDLFLKLTSQGNQWEGNHVLSKYWAENSLK